MDSEEDVRSIDSRSVGSLEDFVDEKVYYDEGEEDPCAVSQKNIITGKRSRKETTKYLPENFEEIFMEGDTYPSSSESTEEDEYDDDWETAEEEDEEEEEEWDSSEDFS